MACNHKGDMVGSLSGGCIEEHLIQSLKQGAIANDNDCYQIYGETQSDIERFKLPCGGSLGVLIEPLTATRATTKIFHQIEQALQRRQSIQRYRDWPSDSQHVNIIHQPPSITLTQDHSDQPRSLDQIYGPSIHLMIIGVCEVSRYLAEFALATGYRVSVCDPRPEMKEQWTTDNVTLYTAMPDDIIRQYANDNHCAIVAVSHDPRIDDMGLMDAFYTNAFYIGAMGSKKTSANRRQRLESLGVSKQQLKQLHAPVGLDIHSKTPAEIAISIIAEIIHLRNSADGQ
jgi:xanthine dehydrogenase accessory factor